MIEEEKKEVIVEEQNNKDCLENGHGHEKHMQQKELVNIEELRPPIYKSVGSSSGENIANEIDENITQHLPDKFPW